MKKQCVDVFSMSLSIKCSELLHNDLSENWKRKISRMFVCLLFVTVSCCLFLQGGEQQGILQVF